MSERKNISVQVVSQEQGDDGPFNFGDIYTDSTLDKVIQSLVAIREGIPDDFRASARCEIDSVHGYEDSSYARIKVSYKRLGTDAEMAQREEKERQQSALVVDRQRAEYERLKEMFD